MNLDKSISEIRNPWLRRAAVVAFTPLHVGVCALAAVLDEWPHTKGDIRAAWQGPRPTQRVWLGDDDRGPRDR